MAVEVVVERTARVIVLAAVRDTEQGNPRKRCYYSLPASS